MTADGREVAGVALVNNGVTVRLLYQQGSTTHIRYRRLAGLGTDLERAGQPRSTRQSLLRHRLRGRGA